MPLVLSIKANGNSVRAGEVEKRTDQTYTLPIYIPWLTMQIYFHIPILLFCVSGKEQFDDSRVKFSGFLMSV